MPSTLTLVPTNGTTARRLAAALRDRMSDLGYDVQMLSRESNVSDFVIRQMLNETVKNYRTDSKRRIATALGWTPESIDRILRGDEPVEGRRAGSGGGGHAEEVLDLSVLSHADRLWLKGVWEGLRRSPV